MTMADRYVNHFLESAGTKDGYGVFRENKRAVTLAKSLGKVKRRKCQRYGLVPVELLRFMRAEGLLRPSYEIREDMLTREKFREVVKDHCRTLHVKGDHDDAREDQRIRKAMEPELNKSFGTQDQVWDAIEWSKYLMVVRRPR